VRQLAGAKAAYRFLANGRVDEADILGGHFAATRERVRASSGMVLLLQHQPRCDRGGRAARRHSGEGLDTGEVQGNRCAQTFGQSRRGVDRGQGKRPLARQRPAVDGPPGVHVPDRESDIYELFCLVLELGTHCVIRTCNDRLAGDGTHTVASEMAAARVRGLHHVELRDAQGGVIHAVLEIRARRVHLLPPIGKQKRYPPLDLTVLHVTERNPPRSRKPVEWKLLTDLPVHTRREAIKKIHWYAMRWKIEMV
jgi:hypothetical protein